jgi:CheY-like chemotaxis protein
MANRKEASGRRPFNCIHARFFSSSQLPRQGLDFVQLTFQIEPELSRGSGVGNTGKIIQSVPLHVLIVEDNSLIRELVADALREEGFDVVQACDGEEALAWCRQRVADVLITDIHLPGPVDGWQIAEYCREHDPELPVIYMTGFSPAQHRPVPGSRTLQKPCAPDAIVGAVKEMGDRRPVSH